MEIQDIMDRYEDDDVRSAELYALLGLSGPGGYVLREPDCRIMVWASERDAQNDNGGRATYRSSEPITDEEWMIVTRLAWIHGHEDLPTQAR